MLITITFLKTQFKLMNESNYLITSITFEITIILHIYLLFIILKNISLITLIFNSLD